MFRVVPFPRSQLSCGDLIDSDLPVWPSFPSLPSFARDLSNWTGQIKDTDSEVHNTDKEFRIRLDLRHFSPEEVKITAQDGRISVHAKHEEKQDTHGFIKREITRVFQLPKDVDEKSATSSMNSNGVMHIKIQKLAIEPPKDVEVPVQFES